MSDSKKIRNRLADLPEFSNLLAAIEKEVTKSKISETSSDHVPVETSYTGQNRLKSETETPSYYSYFNSETSSSVEFDSCSSSSDNSYINYDPKDVMIWETFHCQPCDTEEDLLDWLDHNKPSKINIKGMLPTIVKKIFIKKIFLGC